MEQDLLLHCIDTQYHFPCILVHIELLQCQDKQPQKGEESLQHLDPLKRVDHIELEMQHERFIKYYSNVLL